MKVTDLYSVLKEVVTSLSTQLQPQPPAQSPPSKELGATCTIHATQGTRKVRRTVLWDEGSQKTWGNCNSGDLFWDLSQEFELNTEGIQHNNLLKFATARLSIIIEL